MITIIFGAPGAGKTSLNTYFLKQTYYSEGDKLLDYCREEIAEQNREFNLSLKAPEKPPIFSDFAVKLLVDYEEEYEPYFINGYYFGMENENMPTQYVPPGSKIFLSEAQRYFDSRKSSTFPQWVSRAFEMHRHFGFDIYMDVQRERLIDLNIRELCRRFIEVQGMDHEELGTGKIRQTTFRCREFDNLQSVEEYINGTGRDYKETRYENRGNIFNCFDSRNQKRAFLPKKGGGYCYLPFIKEGGEIPKEYEMFYKTGEPKEYRAKPKEKKEAKAA